MKKIILILAVFCFLFSASGQEIEWQNTIGGSGADWLYSINQTADGGYICGGYSVSNVSGDKTENCLGDNDYWVVKLDLNGLIEWQNTIGGSQDDWLFSIVQTSDGGYICGGYSSSDSSGDKTQNTVGGDDYWIVKLDAGGIIQWEKTIGGADWDWITSIAQTSDGGYICGGYSLSPIGGDKTENCFGNFDYWVIKLNAAGSIQWQNTIGGSDFDQLNSIVQTSDGGYICGGFSDSDSSGEKTENSLGIEDYWIVKLDSAGVIQWQNTIGGYSDDKLYSIQQTADGGYICGGYSFSDISGDKTENSLDYDYWVVKLDATGNIQWQNTFGGNDFDYLFSTAIAADSGYICGGYSLSYISGDKTESSSGGGWDYWVVRLDTSGNILWQNTISADAYDWFTSGASADDGGYVCGGQSYSNISGDKTEDCIGNFDYWVVKLKGKHNVITGKLFLDVNSNAIQDAGEPPVSNKTISEISTTRWALSQQNGYYSVSVLDSGNFSVTTSSINYYNIIPSTHNAYFSGIQQADSLNDFAFQPAGVFNDLCLTITPLGDFRSNMNSSYMVNYENVGTTTLNGTVIFFPDNDVTFVSSNVTPTSVTTDSCLECSNTNSISNRKYFSNCSCKHGNTNRNIDKFKCKN